MSNAILGRRRGLGGEGSPRDCGFAQVCCDFGEHFEMFHWLKVGWNSHLFALLRPSGLWSLTVSKCAHGRIRVRTGDSCCKHYCRANTDGPTCRCRPCPDARALTSYLLNPTSGTGKKTNSVQYPAFLVSHVFGTQRIRIRRTKFAFIWPNLPLIKLSKISESELKIRPTQWTHAANPILKRNVCSHQTLNLALLFSRKKDVNAGWV